MRLFTSGDLLPVSICKTLYQPSFILIASASSIQAERGNTLDHVLHKLTRVIRSIGFPKTCPAAASAPSRPLSHPDF